MLRSVNAQLVESLMEREKSLRNFEEGMCKMDCNSGSGKTMESIAVTTPLDFGRL
jgi:hypothetical protein